MISVRASDVVYMSDGCVYGVHFVGMDVWNYAGCAEQGSAEDFGKEYKKGEDGLPSPP